MDKPTQVRVQRVVRMDGGSVGVMSTCGAREKKTGERDMASAMAL